jgi:hypothetical protein
MELDQNNQHMIQHLIKPEYIQIMNFYSIKVFFACQVICNFKNYYPLGLLIYCFKFKLYNTVSNLAYYYINHSFKSAGFIGLAK